MLGTLRTRNVSPERFPLKNLRFLQVKSRRKRPKNTPIEEDILFGLGIGADDYITKPFRIQELRARVAAHLRREKREHHSTLSFEPDIRFDLSAKVLYVSEQPVPLTKSEYSICEYLAKNRGQVFTKEQIYEAVFGFDGTGDNSTISTHIKNIRAKLEHFKISPISTVWGIGYKWE